MGLYRDQLAGTKTCVHKRQYDGLFLSAIERFVTAFQKPSDVGHQNRLESLLWGFRGRYKVYRVGPVFKGQVFFNETKERLQRPVEYVLAARVVAAFLTMKEEPLDL